MNSSGSVVSVRVAKTFAEVAVETSQAELTLVDIPIGLPSAERPGPRRCDLEARKLLESRAPVVFPVPAREAVWSHDFNEASRRNREIMGKGLNMFTWGICPKIRDPDAVFRIVQRLQLRIRETHPELCFRLLKGGRAVDEPKKSTVGRETRLALLAEKTTNLDSAIQKTRHRYPAGWLKLDDILDAGAAAVVARLAAQEEVCSVPHTRELDACGLAMEMVGLRA